MFFERPETGTKALLVHIQHGESELSSVSELRELVISAGLEPVACITSGRKEPHPGTYVGAGKLDEIAQVAIQAEAGLSVFDEDL